MRLTSIARPGRGLPRCLFLVGALVLAITLSACGEGSGTLLVYLTSSSDLAEDPLDPSVVRWLRVRVEGPDMGVVTVEGAFERGGSTHVPPVPAGDGRRIIVEGLTGQDGLLVSRGESLPQSFSTGRNEVELYVGLVERFSSAAGGGLDPPRRGAAIAAAEDGSVLIIGGASGDEPEGVARVERFDPSSGRLTGVLLCDEDEACSLADRWGHSAVTLADGLLFTGGVDATGPVQGAAICSQGRCRGTTMVELGRTGGVVAALPGGGGFLLGGWEGDAAGRRVDHVDAEGVPTKGAFMLPVEGEGLFAGVDGEGGLLVMGFSDGVPRRFEFEVGGALRQEELADVGDRREGALVSLADGRLLLVGGRDAEGQGVSAVEIFDPRMGTVCRAGNLLRPRWRHAATRLRDGRVLVTGGIVSVGGATPDVELLDPRYLPEGASCERVEGRLEVRSASRLSAPRSGHAAIGLQNGMLLVVGGVDGRGEPTARVEIFVPSS